MPGTKTLTLVGVMLGLLGLTIWYVYFATPQTLWSHSSDQYKNLEPITLDHHADILEDYFLYERLGESLHYKLEHSLEYNSQKAPPPIKQAFSAALGQVFKGKVRPPEAMIILAQGGLFEKFNHSFLENLILKDIEQGQIHWSLRFVPEQHLNLNYQEHLASSQVLEWKPQTDWVKKAEEQLRPQQGKLNQKLQDLTIPGNGRPFQYLAGTIHYELDLEKIKEETPPLGKLTFRKFYRVDEGRPFRQYFESAGFHLEHIRLKSENNFPLITVDLVETFTLNQMAPQLKHINLNFSGVVEQKREEYAVSNEENRLTLVGELSTSDYDSLLFEMNLTNLSFDIDQGLISNLNEEETRYTIKLLPREIDLKKSTLFKQQIRNKILREHQRDLLKSIKADLFSKRLMGGARL